MLKCPWHGYEYDVRTGCALFDERRRLRRVAVEERGVIVVERARVSRSDASPRRPARCRAEAGRHGARRQDPDGANGRSCVHVAPTGGSTPRSR